jgi:hypothetical protein
MSRNSDSRAIRDEARFVELWRREASIITIAARRNHVAAPPMDPNLVWKFGAACSARLM